MAISGLLNLLYPPKCLVCRELLPRNDHICPRCARELKPSGGQEELHGDFFSACYAPFLYVEPLRGSVLRYKFGGMTHYAQSYGRWMVDCLRRREEAPFDLVTFVPLNRWRRWRRGYDQAELLAREVASQIGVPLVPGLKKARRSALSGMKGEKALRAAHILGAFSLKRGAKVAGRRILLVDDLVTTGATLSECSRVLLMAGAAEVVCLTLARKPEKR